MDPIIVSRIGQVLDAKRRHHQCRKAQKYPGDNRLAEDAVVPQEAERMEWMSASGGSQRSRRTPPQAHGAESGRGRKNQREPAEPGFVVIKQTSGQMTEQGRRSDPNHHCSRKPFAPFALRIVLL